jgi:3-dehydroquinate synthase
LAVLLERLGLPVRPPALPLESWLELMGRDKKNEEGRITLILLDELGRAAIAKNAPTRALEEFLAAA